MKTKDILKQAIAAFDGTVIVVSHDREFLDGLVDRVYEFGHGKVTECLGGIYEFLEKKKLASLQELEAEYARTQGREGRPEGAAGSAGRTHCRRLTRAQAELRRAARARQGSAPRRKEG